MILVGRAVMERQELIPSGQLALRDLSEVRGALFDASAKWFDIGIELKLSVGTLETVREDFPHAGDCLREMCIKWLRRIDPRPSWAALIKVLESRPVGEGHLAQELRDKYCQGREGILANIYSTPGPSPPGVLPTSHGPPSFSITDPPGKNPTLQSATVSTLTSTGERSELKSPLLKSASSPQIPTPNSPKLTKSWFSDKSQSVLSDHLRGDLEELREEHNFHSLPSAAPPVDIKFNFIPPSIKVGFLERVFKDHVSLGRAYFNRTRLSVIGDIRVTNVSYEKKVSVVCTWNNWDKVFEAHAEFNGSHGVTDTFTFELPVCCSHYSTMQFAIRYITGGQVFWDNNQGTNYVVQIKFPTLAASDTMLKEDSATPNRDKCTQ